MKNNLNGILNLYLNSLSPKRKMSEVDISPPIPKRGRPRKIQNIN